MLLRENQPPRVNRKAMIRLLKIGRTAEQEEDLMRLCEPRTKPFCFVTIVTVP